MGFRARLRRIWSRPPVRIGAIGGILASLAGIFGYVVVPVLTGAQPSLTEASVAAATTPERFSVLYHAAVSFLPPFALAFGGTLVARNWGFSGRRVDATVVGGSSSVRSSPSSGATS